MYALSPCTITSASPTAGRATGRSCARRARAGSCSPARRSRQERRDKPYSSVTRSAASIATEFPRDGRRPRIAWACTRTDPSRQMSSHLHSLAPALAPTLRCPSTNVRGPGGCAGRTERVIAAGRPGSGVEASTSPPARASAALSDQVAHLGTLAVSHVFATQPRRQASRCARHRVVVERNHGYRGWCGLVMSRASGRGHRLGWHRRRHVYPETGGTVPVKSLSSQVTKMTEFGPHAFDAMIWPTVPKGMIRPSGSTCLLGEITGVGGSACAAAVHVVALIGADPAVVGTVCWRDPSPIERNQRSWRPARGWTAHPGRR